jgi:hypothetical protein
MSLVRGLIQPGLSTVKKAPFYSAVDDALAAIKRPKGTGAEFYTELTKQPGVKKAELADRKLEQAFKAKGKITKEEAQQVLADNPPPQVGEFVYDITHRQYTDLLDKKRIENGYKSWSDVPDKKRWEWEEELNPRLEKYGSHITHNGKNYREILLKLPSNAPKKEIFNVYDEGEALVGQGVWPPTERMQQIIANNPNYRVMREFVNDKSPNDYVSGHWEGEPNVLAHARVQDIDGPNGEKILQIEEIQSDWHQAGRKKGYKPDNYIEQSNALDREFFNLVAKRAELKDEAQRLGYFGEGSQALTEEANSITPKLMKLQEQRDNMQNVINYGVPEAPFKKNWHELTMKRLLNYAADNGYDSIAITPGLEQAKRYDLSKQVDDLQVYRSPDGTFDIKATLMRDASTQNVGNRIAPEQLSDYVGQTLAEKLLAQGNNTQKFYNGADLSIGGEGMKGFYDKMLPDYLNTFGKPYGAQVQLNAYQFDIPKEARTVPLHTFPITPEMRESIKQKGLPLYQQVGIPTVGTGAASQMVEQEVPEQEEPEYSKGGSIAKQAALAKLKQMRGEMAPRAEAVKSLIARDQNRYLADVVPNSLTNAEIEAEIQRMAARARASGQQEGVLPRAERDANLAKFLIESKVPTRAFHGPGRHSGVTDIDQFKTTESGTGGAWFASNPDYAAEFGDGYTMPVHLNMTNPVDLSKFGNRSLTVNQWMKAMQKAGVDTSEMQIKPARVLGGANKQGTPNYDLWELLWRADDGQNNIPEILKKQGFDGILAPAEYDSKTPNYVVFEPTQVKSALGNRGTFDPNEPDMRKAKGGAVKHQVKDSKSGKVRITNSRDTMFMELSNKKLKRK